MRSFYKPVDKRSREEMTAYLYGHFRYDTMNPWNGSTSYACNIKIHNLGFERSVEEKLYNMLQTSEFSESLNDQLRDFGEEHNFNWQAALNGRSGGYLVLYQGCLEPSGFKSYCSQCGQQNYTSVTENNNICGRCSKPTRIDYPETHKRIVTFPGHGTDINEDFRDWTLGELRSRVTLVQSFDILADSIVNEAYWHAQNYKIRKETYTVEKMRWVLAPI